MIEQLNEEFEQLGELKTQLENIQEEKFGEKVDGDESYQKDLARMEKDKSEEVSAFAGEFGDILAGFKSEIFIDAAENNEERVVEDTRNALMALKAEIVA